MGIPDTEYPTYIKMSSGEFVSLCKDFTQLSDSLKIEVKDQKATFSITGKAGAGKVIMKNNNAEKIEDQVTIVSDEEVSCSYGLQYLNSFAKASSLSGVVGNLCQNRADRFFYLQQSGNDLAQFLQYVQRWLYFSPPFCDDHGNTGQFSVRCCSGYRDGSSAVDLSQTCKNHRALPRGIEQSAEICTGAFTYRMAWCQ